MQSVTALTIPAPRAESIAGRARRAFDTARRFLFGHDVFISYARADALEYAQALADALTRRNIATYVDQLGAPPGPRLPPTLLLQLRLSSMLVLVGSPGASASAHVAREVDEYTRHNDLLFVVDVAGALDDTPWYTDRLKGGPGRRITPAELEAAVPSDAVVENILRKMDFTRREERLRRTLRYTLAGIVALLLVGGAGVTAVWAQAGRWQDEARRARAGLAMLQDSARVARLEAQEARTTADGAAMAASQARRRSAVADSNRLAAEAGARRANEDASAARDRVAALEKVQEALSLAERSVAALDTTGAGISESLLLAVESLRSAWTPQGASAWLRAIARVSRPLTVRPGHNARVRAVAVTADGARIATGAEDGSIHVWQVHELADGQAALTPVFASGIQATPERDLVAALTFSPDGRVLAVGGGALLELWDVAGPAPALRVSRSYPRTISDLQFSRDGGVLAAVAGDRVELIHPADGRVTELHAGRGARLAAFSPDSRVLALAGEIYGTGQTPEPWLQVWDLEMGFRVDSVAAEPMDALSFTSGSGIATSTQRWSLGQTNGQVTLSAPTRIAASPDLSRDRVRLYPGSVVVRSDRGTETTFLLDAMVSAPVWNQEWIVIGSSDGSVALLDTKPRSESLRLQSPAYGRTAFSRDGRWLALAGEDRDATPTLRVIEVGTGREALRDSSSAKPAREPHARVGGVAIHLEIGFTHDSRWLVVDAPDTVRTYSTQGWRRSHALPRSEYVRFLLLSPDGQQLAMYPVQACGTDEGSIWEVSTGRPVQACGRVTAWSRLGEPEGWAAGLTASGGRRLQDPSTGREIVSMQWPSEIDSFSSGGEWLATVTFGRIVLLWRIGHADAMIDEACARLPRNLTPEEWQRVFPYQAYRPSCPALPIPPAGDEEH